jgi:hypothetical protein
LLNRYTVKSRIGGSNPPLSARFQYVPENVVQALPHTKMSETACRLCAPDVNRSPVFS